MKNADLLQRESRRMRAFTTFVLAGMAALTLFSLLLPVLRQDRIREDLTLIDVLGRDLVLAGPTIWYLFGLWSLRRLFDDLAEGRLFQPAVARGVSGLGWALAWGAGTQVVIVPNLLRWISREPGGSVLHYDVSAIVLGVVGLTLTVLARLLQRAAAMHDELEQII